ncbi:MAG: HD domain-containing protein [Clostridiales bacterium]|nr:HD domain-containing protein [Clostridiales bacterium]
MSHKLERVRAYVDSIFNTIEDEGEKRAACIHTYGVAQCCALLAAKRSLDAELAAAIGLLHDVYSYKTGIHSLHAQNGAEMVRVAFKYALKDLFTEQEQILIKSAIYHHANKDLRHDAYDELIKDSDIFQNWLYFVSSESCTSQRLFRVFEEFSLPVPSSSLNPAEPKKVKLFLRSRLADIAESLAGKSISGERTDAEYMNIVRYFPEEAAFDELKNAWCAAFIFHCCLEAGIELPLRLPHTAKEVANCRFVCVAAWYEWGEGNGYCHNEKDGFSPERGDIVIYNNIIPKENKPESSTWCDHIGIVLSADDTHLVAAEGNDGNRNVSGIIRRKRDQTIGCYVRIPEDYTYEGWKIDFKTGEIRVEGIEAQDDSL